MKYSEMTLTQQKAFKNIKWAANSLLGELENTMLDYPEDSKEHKDAEAYLQNHNALVNDLYHNATTEIYGKGYCCFNLNICKRELRDINFCGKEWLMQMCKKRITKEGY